MAARRRKRRRWLRLAWRIVLLLVLGAAAIGAGWWYQNRQKEQTPDTDPMLAAQESSAKVTRGPIRITTEGSGQVEPAQKTTVNSSFAVKIDKVEAEAGEKVAAGDVIATIDEQSVKDQILALEQQLADADSALNTASQGGSSSLTAPVSGRIKRIFVKSGDVLTDVVRQHGGIMELSADGRMKISFRSEEQYPVGMEVKVRRNESEADGYIARKRRKNYTVLFTDGENFPVDEQAQVLDAEGKVLGDGQIMISQSYLVNATYGVADSISYEVNQYVDRGSTLLTRTDVNTSGEYIRMLEKRQEILDELQQMRSLETDPEITAAADGILSSVMLTEDGALAEDQPMYTIISTEEFYLRTKIDELEIAGVKEGQKATVVFDAFDDREYEGTVQKVSSLGSNTGGVTTYTVTIALPGAEEIKTAMSATAAIVTDEKEDALLVPVDALQTKDGKRIVTVLTEDDQGTLQNKDVEVEVGLVNNTMAEITSGLSEGDTVLVIGSSRLEEMLGMMRAGRQNRRQTSQDSAQDPAGGENG